MGKQSRKSFARRQRRRRARLRLMYACGAAFVIFAVLIFFAPGGRGGGRALDIAPGVLPTAADALTLEPTNVPTPQPTPLQTVPPTESPTPPPTPSPTPQATPEPEPVTITITATGDATLGVYAKGGGYSNFSKAVEERGYAYFLENFRDYFSEDDFTLVNLEGVLTDRTDKRPGRTFNFRGDPEYVEILTSGSVEVCSLGNNHALDFKKQGFIDTCQTLQDNGIGFSGFDEEYYAECKGHTVGFLSFNTWDHKVKDMIAAVEEAKQKCDLLIVSAHWGEELHDSFTSYTEKLGKAFVDAGADLVVGNHPHVPGAIMRYKGKYIIHALGNFCFGGNDAPSRTASRTIVFRQSFVISPDGDVSDGGIDIVPGWISGHTNFNDFQPYVANTADGKAILADIYRASKGKFKPEKILWLDDSYVYQHGLLEDPRATVAPDSTTFNEE